MNSLTPPPPLRSDIKSHSGFIRGRRLRKNSKGLISFASFLTGASVLALGAFVATTTPVVAGTGSIEEALYESLPAALTQIASLQSYQQRQLSREAYPKPLLTIDSLQRLVIKD